MAIVKADFKRASELLPKKIEKVFDQNKVREQIGAIGEGPVKRMIEFELINLAGLMSVGGNLNAAQVPFIADQLIELYPNESIADFKICFNRGAIGVYGDIQRLDGVTIGVWMRQYLDEKYEVLEKQLMSEKDDLYKAQKIQPELSSDKSKEWLDKWQKAVSDVETKRISDLTEKQIRKEGREKPASQSYIAPDEQLLITQDKIKRVAAERYKGLYSFSGFQHFTIESFTIFAKSKEEAQEIYMEAI